MINFRFHLVSLVAVFLAMGLGILVGSTVIDQKIVNRLDREIASVRSENKTRKAESKQLDQENSDQQDFIALSAPYVVDGRLDGQSVAIIAERGVDGGAVKKTETLLRSAGADVPAVLWLDDSWLLDSDQRVADLQTAVGGQGTPTVMRARALDLLARRLSAVPANVTTTTTKPKASRTSTPDSESSTTRASTTTTSAPAKRDALAALDSAGFLSVTDGNASDFSRFPAHAAHVLLITGDKSHFAGEGMTAAVTHALVRAGVPSVVAAIYDEGSDAANPPERGASLSSVLDDRVLSKAVSTLDDLDLEQGRIGATLSLEVVAGGSIGHYGYGPDASAPLPPHPS